MKKSTLGILITASLLIAAFPFDKAKADNPGTLMKDVNFDGIVNAVDASMVLTEYAATSAGGETTFSKTQVFVADTDHDGNITAVDASHILSSYSLAMAGSEQPIRTVLFGITRDGNALGYQALTIESAEEFIDRIRKDGEQYTIVADTTIYYGKEVVKATYTIREET